MRVFTIGHGTRPAEELVDCLREAAVGTVIDVRRFPVSRRNPQFGGPVIAETLREAGIAYRHAGELGGLRSREGTAYGADLQDVRALPARPSETNGRAATGERKRPRSGEERFACIRTAAFRSYAARMGTLPWQQGLAAALAEPAPCLMCAETQWARCHRRLISEYLIAHGHEVWHLIRTGEGERHRLSKGAEARDGRLFLCGELVA